MGKVLEKILVTDDEPGMCRLLETVLSEEGYRTVSCQKPQEALKILDQETFDLVITDIRMPKVNGMEILQAVKSAYPNTPVLIITAYGTVESAVKAIKMGACDYVTKPFKNDEIKLAVSNALEKQRLIDENKRLKAELAAHYKFAEIIGNSAKMHDVFQLIKQLVQTDATVLIEGESGTGKELVARAIHFNSPRRNSPFLAIHCGGLPENLLESELFGFVRGAFTDAMTDREGLLESAGGGTVFLDEVGDMPPTLQVKLLRFLQDHEIRRIGSSESRKVDVRIIAATNKQLRKEVDEERFREDLYYRISVVPLRLPPLRERKEDIPLLAQHFLDKVSRKIGKGSFSISPEALHTLLEHDWPGNIRELENAIEHAVTLSESLTIIPDSLPATICGEINYPDPASLQELPFREAKQKTLDSFEKIYLSRLLKKSGGNITHAAQSADMDRKNFQELLKKHNLNSAQEQPDLVR